MDDAVLQPNFRLSLVHTVCKVKKEYVLDSRGIDQLLLLISAISADHENKTVTAEVDRIGRLAKALKGSFPPDHDVWSFVRWSRPI